MKKKISALFPHFLWQQFHNTSFPVKALLGVSLHKPQIYQGSGRGQNRGNYDRCNYDQQGYQNKHRLDSGDMETV